ncbi:MAG: hypothetical protein JJU15_03645 [Pararhodobacter sp.]|nr:hypothetical protein [Pararhodobacter sp.]
MAANWKDVVLSVTNQEKLKAPQDKKTTKARLNWLLRMLKVYDPRLRIRAPWPGRRTFIELLEASATEFYGLVGQHLRTWQALPPKPVRSSAVQETSKIGEVETQQ